MKYLRLFKPAWTRWSEDKCSRLGAALAYYAIFSIAPLLIVIFGVVGMIFGDRAPQQLMEQIVVFVGPTAAQAIVGMVSASHRHAGGLGPAILGGATMFIGATGMFVALQDALNTIWGVDDRKTDLRLTIKRRLLSFLMVVVALAVLLASVMASAVLQGVGSYLGGFVPIPGWLDYAEIGLSFALVTALFAMIYRVLPDVAIAWSDVWIGAAFTAVLFVLGKFILGLYLGRGSVGSPYGAAGSLVVLLVWVYYAAQIFLFGAEYTQVYATTFGSLQRDKDRAPE